MEAIMNQTSCSNVGLNNMPSELLLKIYETTEPEDVQSARLISRKLYSFVKLHSNYLPRLPRDVTFEGSNESLVFTCGRIRLNLSNLDDVREAMENYCSTIEVAHLKIKHIPETGFGGILTVIVEQLRRFRQFAISALSLKNVHFAVEEIECLTRFLPAIVKTCKDVSVEHSNFTVDDLRIFVNLQIEMSHFRLLDSAKDEATDKLNGDLLQIVGRQFNEIDRNSSFGAEIDHVSPESVCDFLKSWLRASNPFFFNLSVFNCDMVWMTRFMECCFQADLQHQYFEFASKTHSSAHVKVCFSESNQTCRLWPIFDMPRRMEGHTYCSARYYRDF